MDQGIRRIAVPILAAFAVQPQNSAETSPVSWNSESTSFLQMSALELCLYFVRHLLRKVPVPIACGTDPRSLGAVQERIH